MVVLKQKKKCVSPELSVLADGHHDQQVSQDAHQHDQRQEADQSHPLWHAVTMETTKRHHHNKSVRICREKDIVRQDADVKIHLFSLHREAELLPRKAVASHSFLHSGSLKSFSGISVFICRNPIQGKTGSLLIMFLELRLKLELRPISCAVTALTSLSLCLCTVADRFKCFLHFCYCL